MQTPCRKRVNLDSAVPVDAAAVTLTITCVPGMMRKVGVWLTGVCSCVSVCVSVCLSVCIRAKETEKFLIRNYCNSVENVLQCTVDMIRFWGEIWP